MSTTTGLTSIAMIAALAVGFRAPAEEVRPTWYNRLGGMPAIEAVVDGLLNRIVKDDRINGWFGWAAKPERAAAYKSHLAAFIYQATGGPRQYQGRDMQATHHGMAITKKAFDSVVEDLTATLDSLKVPKAEKDKLLGMLAPLESQIVQQRPA